MSRHKKNSNVIHIKNCVICNSKSFVNLVGNIKDNIGGFSEYSGNIKKCITCGHVFLSPVLHPSQIVHAYRKYYTRDKNKLNLSSNAKSDRFSMFLDFYLYKYQNIFSIKAWFINLIYNTIPLAKFFLDKPVRYISMPSDLNKIRLLDVGCGKGDFLLRAKYCGYRVTGIDFDPKTIDIVNSRGLYGRAMQIQDLPEKEKYDIITSSHVIEHVYRPKEFLLDIYKRLKKDGYFYIATPNYDSAGRKSFGKNWRGYDVPRHMHFFNTKNLKDILYKIGFSRVIQVYDFPQSRGILRSSFLLQKKNKQSIINKAKSISSLFSNKFYLSRRLEVAVFKCFK